ncbi:MAG: alginate export family protein [Pseudomonadota bacterium]
MNRQHRLAILISAFTCASVAPALADEDMAATSLSEMITKGKASLNFRYRYEGVSDDRFDEDAGASLLRSRLTLASATYKGFSSLLEVDNVTSIGDSDYNSTENGNGEFPVVADPEGTDLNQVWVAYAFEQGKTTLGRQRINHGNQRFVGGVAWRQNEQTYDSLRLDLTPVTGLRIDMSYVTKIRRIFGPDDGAQPAEWEGDTALVRADYKLSENHSLAGFAYHLDVEDVNGYPAGRTVNNANDTYGIEYAGKIKNLGLKASFATQSDAGDSELSYDTEYYFLEGALKLAPVTVTAGYEVLAADNGKGFQTPLATLHKFQGWADMFLATPADGIEDAYVKVGGKLGPVKLAAIYHDFQAESSSDDFGTEFDFIATWPVNKMVTLQGKYANFFTDNEDRYVDSERFWLTAQIKL